MRINIYKLFFLFFVTLYNSVAQPTPEVPEKIRIDNMVLHISENISSTIQSEVDALHLNKKYFEIFIDRINIYFPIIERILDEEEMPNMEDEDEFSENDCTCPVCRVMNNIYTRWEGWAPNTLFETTIKKHIDKM